MNGMDTIMARNTGEGMLYQNVRPEIATPRSALSPSTPAMVLLAERQESQRTQPAPAAVARSALGHMQFMRRYQNLRPAPPPPSALNESRTITFFDLPAEIRIEIYKLALERVCIQIGPLDSERCCPHALVRTSRQVRNEALPLIHSLCPIRANVTDFNFNGMLAWMARIPPTEQFNLAKNQDLIIYITSTEKPPRESQSLRKWLHMRADPYRPQPKWKYSGRPPQKTVVSDMRRRVKRMSEEGKRAELVAMLGAIGVHVP